MACNSAPCGPGNEVTLVSTVVIYWTKYCGCIWTLWVQF